MVNQQISNRRTKGKKPEGDIILRNTVSRQGDVRCADKCVNTMSRSGIYKRAGRWIYFDWISRIRLPETQYPALSAFEARLFRTCARGEENQYAPRDKTRRKRVIAHEFDELLTALSDRRRRERERSHAVEVATSSVIRIATYVIKLQTFSHIVGESMRHLAGAHDFLPRRFYYSWHCNMIRLVRFCVANCDFIRQSLFTEAPVWVRVILATSFWLRTRVLRPTTIFAFECHRWERD